MSQFSTLLRSSLNEGSAKNLNFQNKKIHDSVSVKRLQMLERKRKSGHDVSQSQQQPTLTFKNFTEGIPELKAEAIRAKFNDFIKSVQEIAGADSVTSSELFHAAHVVYKAVSNRKREELEKFFGRISNSLYSKAEQQAQSLTKWKQEYEQYVKPQQTQQKKVTEEYFGASIEFQTPFASSDLLSSLSSSSSSLPSTAISLSSLGELDSSDDESTVSQARQPIIDHFDRKAVRAQLQQQQQQQQQQNGGPLDWEWLRRECESLATYDPDTGAILVSEEDLAKSALAILKSKRGDDHIQQELLDLLGFNSFDLISSLLSNRNQFRNVNPVALPSAPPSSGGGGGGGRSQVPAQQRNLVGVTIQTEKEKELEKRKKKMERKMVRQTEDAAGGAGGGGGGNSNNIAFIDEAKLDEQANALKEWKKDFSGGGAGERSNLPAGATRKEMKGYDEVFIPPVIPPPPKEADLVPVTDLDDWAQLAFPGTKRLNRIQSRCFHAAFKTNHNLLICAPTGAGKTNVAMLAVLHELGQHITAGVLQRDMFKIIYVAPMKALAQEVVDKFSQRLAPLGIVVKELTGDMQLTKREIMETQMIVTTPEKWDVMTRKSQDGGLMQMVRLLIIDEVHLLHEERGPVIEILVARTLRMVESSQRMCRIVGLSATLPNYHDVAVFLGVNPQEGLFYFDNTYRPVPLTQFFIGVKDPNPIRKKKVMNDICFEKTVRSLKEGYQVMVFVHARNDTYKTAKYLREVAHQEGLISLFQPENTPQLQAANVKVMRSKNNDLRELWQDGFSMHHAGMIRQDRALVEKYFIEGHIRVLVCTATLAWGVNLPAHTVIIKGTQIYNAKRGGWVDVGMLDVMQIFGRAGRPQYDVTGEAIMITSSDRLPHYLALLNHQMPIESQFIEALPDHLNAEIILGTVTNLKEAISWLSYTYLYTRMLRNPMVYGITYEEKATDGLLSTKRRSLILEAAKTLMKCKMVKFDVSSQNFFTTDVGRVASHYYIHHESVEKFNGLLTARMTDEEMFHVISCSKEFEQIKVRDEEISELEVLARKYCPVRVKSGIETSTGKTNCLLQTYISNGYIEGSTLVSDSLYVIQSAARIARSLFEMVLKKGRSFLANRFLTMCKMIDKRIWDFQHPLRQFSALKKEYLMKLEERKVTLERLIDMSNSEIGSIVHAPAMGETIKGYVNQIPNLVIDCVVQPITRSVLKLDISITGDFKWNARHHGSIEPFWIWVEDGENEHIYHTEYFLLHRAKAHEVHKLSFTIPIFEPLPPQYYIVAVSDRWLEAETSYAVSFKHLILPELHPPHTKLLDLNPLPVTALHNKSAQEMYSFTHFNPIQTQVFHQVYHTDENILLGAPTGSGKTLVAELAMLRLQAMSPGYKTVYIAPLKALARERIEDWNRAGSLRGKCGMKIIELTGDTAPDALALKTADVLITTPEKWDGISRNWKSRGYVQKVGLVVIDEIHLLGADRGPVLEVIVSRMRYISSHTEKTVRIVGLSTALANARDLAEWLGIEGPGLFNFHPAVRPVPLTVHISGFPGKHYCPRMQTMNKPTYAAITTHSPTKPVLVFVSSRRQTRLTALDLIAFCAADGNPRKWVHMSDAAVQLAVNAVKDANLKHTLTFGIGMHHAGLRTQDRKVVEELFVTQKIQVLVCTSTLAWGVNFPAHLVVIKGTEYYDAKVSRYVDFPITDVLQMMGRAGRPQFDNEGKAVVLVHEPKKNFYMNFLHSPFPVESSLLTQLHDHLNAEVVGGTISNMQDAIDYLTWTFFFRRLLVNPSYYNLDSTEAADINDHLLALVSRTLKDLEQAGCVNFEEDDTIVSLSLGKIASYYYLKYTTVQMFSNKLNSDVSLPDLLDILSSASEFEELPVRHNEDKLNEELAATPGIRWKVDAYSYDSPFTKANLLFQAHFSRSELPISDYGTDTKSVLDQAIRVLQAMVDVCGEAGWLVTTLKVMNLTQMVLQARWLSDSTLMNIPWMDEAILARWWAAGVQSLPELLHLGPSHWRTMTRDAGLNEAKSKDVMNVLSNYPIISIKYRLLNMEGVAHTSTVFNSCEELQIQVTINRQRASSSSSSSSSSSKNRRKDEVDEDDDENGGFPNSDDDEGGGGEGSGGKKKNGNSIRAFCPKFHKPKHEGWFLVLGKGDELVALKRVTVRSNTTTNLIFDVGENAGKEDYILYLISDCYLGLDQQVGFQLTVNQEGVPTQPTEAQGEGGEGGADGADDGAQDNE